MLKKIITFFVYFSCTFLGHWTGYNLNFAIDEDYYSDFLSDKMALQKVGEKKEEDIFFKLKKMSNKKCITENAILFIEVKEGKIYYEKIKNNYYICEKH